MRTINIQTLSKVKTKKNICWDVLIDYTHFIYRHKSSFDYFEVIKDDFDTQIFYYETKLFPWLPISPTKKFISIKQINHNNFSFKQNYKDLNNKQNAYISVKMIEKEKNKPLDFDANNQFKVNLFDKQNKFEKYSALEIKKNRRLQN